MKKTSFSPIEPEISIVAKALTEAACRVWMDQEGRNDDNASLEQKASMYAVLLKILREGVEV